MDLGDTLYFNGISNLREKHGRPKQGIVHYWLGDRNDWKQHTGQVTSDITPSEDQGVGRESSISRFLLNLLTPWKRMHHCLYPQVRDRLSVCLAPNPAMETVLPLCQLQGTNATWVAAGIGNVEETGRVIRETVSERVRVCVQGRRWLPSTGQYGERQMVRECVQDD